MTPATRSSTTHDTLLQSINHLMESLKNINNELEHIRESIQDVKENTNSLTEKTNHLDHKLETMDTATNDRIDKLCLQAGDIAVELDQLQTSAPSQALLNAINKNIDGKLRNIPSLIKHEIENNTNHQTESTTTKSSTKSIGFHQRESKDFHISKLLKLLENHTLDGDSLQDLEIFYDTLASHFATITLTGNALPTYKDLTVQFTFLDHLCSIEKNPRLSPQEIHQAKLNYRTFGIGLRQFLINPKTISKSTAPDSYLQLLSLKHEHDGFLLLNQFISLRSPQLAGTYIDYRNLIDKITLEPGEPLRTFYARAMWLYNEITLAKLLDGSQAYLLEHFLKLLRSTQSQFLIAETSSHWKQLQKHRRDPTHTSKSPPITLNDILRDLELAGITTIPTNPQSHIPSTTTPLIACTSDKTNNCDSNIYQPFAAYTNNKHNNTQPRAYKQQQTISQQKLKQAPKCRLCNNQHPNPWHETQNCPFKDPTYIQNRLIRENVMQHNTLYGKVNKNYTKTMDTPNSVSKPLQATIPKTIKSADIEQHDLLLPELDHPTQDLIPTYHDIPDNHDQEIPDTDYHEIQQFEPTAHSGQGNHNTNPTDQLDLFHDSSDLLFDPQQYLQFTS
jgi:uncharacterized protein YoxC